MAVSIVMCSAISEWDEHYSEYYDMLTIIKHVSLQRSVDMVKTRQIDILNINT